MQEFVVLKDLFVQLTECFNWKSLTMMSRKHAGKTV